MTLQILKVMKIKLICNIGFKLMILINLLCMGRYGEIFNSNTPDDFINEYFERLGITKHFCHLKTFFFVYSIFLMLFRYLQDFLTIVMLTL